MKSQIVVTILMLIFSQQVNGQKFGIGQSAELVKVLMERIANDYNKCDTCKNRSKLYRSWDVKYSDEKIADVIQCYQQEYLTDLQTIADYCEHYIMKDGKLAYTLTQFENISVKKIRKSYDSDLSKKKVGELYFSDNYEHYSKVYLSTNDLATVEWHKTIVSELPKDIQDSISTKLLAARESKKTAEAIAKKKSQEGYAGVPHANHNIYSSNGYGIRHSVHGRNIVSHPKLNEVELKEGGKVIIRVTVDRDGVIADSGVLSATNTTIRELALKQLQSIRFNKFETAPEAQFGVVTFQFKATGVKP